MIGSNIKRLSGGMLYDYANGCVNFLPRPIPETLGTVPSSFKDTPCKLHTHNEARFTDSELKALAEAIMLTVQEPVNPSRYE